MVCANCEHHKSDHWQDRCHQTEYGRSGRDQCNCPQFRERPQPVNLTILPNLVQGSEEWLEQRRGLVTASVVGQLITTRKLGAIDFDCPKCGAAANDPCVSLRTNSAPIKTLHPERAGAAKSESRMVIEPASNDTSRSLTTLLVAERITGWSEPVWINDAMARGINDEPLARDKYSQHYAPVTEVGLMVRDFGGFRLGYSPDGLVGEEGLIEVKSRAPKTQLATILAGHPPLENMAQIQAGLLVSGRKWLDYISWAGGMPMWVKRVYPQQNWFDAITGAVRAFEENAQEMVRIYDEAVVGLHPTERATADLGLVI